MATVVFSCLRNTPAMMRATTVPFDSDVLGVSFHPTEPNIVAVCEITGAVSLTSIGADAPERRFLAKYHTGSARCVVFGVDGKELFSGGTDKSLQVLDATTGKPILKKAKAHGETINCISAIAENMVVTGDDGGVVKIWDTRQRKLVMKYEANEDFISDLAYVPEHNTLLATSADARLSVFDIRKKKPIKVSDNQEDELLSVAVVKNTKKAVIGSEDGVLSFFSWNNWGDCTDRLPGHPGAIESIIKLDEGKILTGCSDGKVRVVTVFPNKIVSSLRDHDLDLPIEGLSLNADGTVLASVSHESLIRLWDISDLGGGNASEEEDEGSEVDDSDKDDGSDGADATENGDEMESEEVQELSASDKKRRIHQDSDSEDEDGLPDPEPVQQVKKVEKRPTKKHVPTAQQKAYFGDLD